MSSFVFDFLANGVDEVQIRSINTLFTKLQSKIITGEKLAQYHKNLPGVLLQWINENQEEKNATSFSKCLKVLIEISKVNSKCIAILNNF